MRTRLLTSMAATVLVVGVGSAALAVTGADEDGASVADEVVAGDQDQLRLQVRDELCDPIGDGEQYRYGSMESSTTVDPDGDQDRDQDQIRSGDRDQLRDQVRDSSCEPDGDGQGDRDRDRDGTCLNGDETDGTSAPVGEQVQTQTREQVQTQEPNQVRTQAQTQDQTQDQTPAQAQAQAEVQTRVQEESQHHSREQAGAPNARGQH